MVQEFRQRYDVAVLTLQQLWAERDALASALRTDIAAPVPARIEGGTSDFKPEFAWSLPPDGKPSRIVPIYGTDLEAVSIDANAELVGASLDALESALQFCKGILSTRVREQGLE